MTCTVVIYASGVEGLTIQLCPGEIVTVEGASGVGAFGVYQ